MKKEITKGNDSSRVKLDEEEALLSSPSLIHLAGERAAQSPVTALSGGVLSRGYLLVTGPGAWLQQIQEGRLLQGAVALSIPLLGIQTDQDPLAQEERGPHDHVPDWSLPPIVEDEIKHHSEAHEEAEEDGVEEAEADRQDVLVHHRGHGEHKQHGRRPQPLP